MCFMYLQDPEWDQGGRWNEETATDYCREYLGNRTEDNAMLRVCDENMPILPPQRPSLDDAEWNCIEDIQVLCRQRYRLDLFLLCLSYSSLLCQTDVPFRHLNVDGKVLSCSADINPLSIPGRVFIII